MVRNQAPSTFRENKPHLITTNREKLTKPTISKHSTPKIKKPKPLYLVNAPLNWEEIESRKALLHKKGGTRQQGQHQKFEEEKRIPQAQRHLVNERGVMRQQKTKARKDELSLMFVSHHCNSMQSQKARLRRFAVSSIPLESAPPPHHQHPFFLHTLRLFIPSKSTIFHLNLN